MNNFAVTVVVMFCVSMTSALTATENLIVNPGFGDVDLDGIPGDAWGVFGNAGFNDFFGGNPHASLFADTPGNFGGVFQLGITMDPEAASYTFTLEDVRLEENIACNAQFGIEYYASDDTTLLSADLVPIDLSVTGDGLTFSMTSNVFPGAGIVRPVILFDNVQSVATEQENIFVFETSMCANGDVLLGDVNRDGVVNLLDVGPFIDLLSTGDFQAEADINMDGSVNLLDVGPFVDILGGG